MKIFRRDDPSWVTNGTCPFYFFERDPSRPNCFVTSAIVMGDANIFDSTDEAMGFIDHDCRGRFESCPFMPALWDLSGGAPVERDLSQTIVVNDSDPFVQISFGWPYPQTEETACDVLMIPTNTYLRFNDMLPTHLWSFSDDIIMALTDECAAMAKPMETGDVFSTSGAGSGYGAIVHCVISGLGGQPVDDVSDVVMTGMLEAERSGAASVVIHPMCLLMGGNEGLAQTLFTEMTGVMKHVRKMTGSIISYVDIVMPPTQEAFSISREVAGVVSS